MWPPQMSANCCPAVDPKRLSTRDAKAWVFLPSAASAACATSGARTIRARIMSATRMECWATSDCSRIAATVPLSWTAAEPVAPMFMMSWPVEGDDDGDGGAGDPVAELAGGDPGEH